MYVCYFCKKKIKGKTQDFLYEIVTTTRTSKGIKIVTQNKFFKACEKCRAERKTLNERDIRRLQ